MAVPVERQLAHGDVVAAHIVAQERLAALADPFHGPAELACGIEHQHLLGVERVLGAEPAADVADHDADLRLGQAEHVSREIVANAVRHLGRGIKRETAGAAIPETESAPRLHRADHHAIIDKLDPRHLLRAGEGGVDGDLVTGLPRK